MRRLLLLPALVALAAAATAQTFPPVPTNGTVFDGAALLTHGELEGINDLSRGFQRDTGAPIAVATLTSLDRYEAKAMGIQRYSTALFNQWKVGKSSANGGILLVVAKEDRKVWVAVGKDWKRDYDAAATKIVRTTITPLFKQGQFGEGIFQGCQALAHLADAPTDVPPGAQGPQGPPMGNAELPPAFGDGPMMPEPAAGGDFPFAGLLCLAVPVLIVVAIVSAARRRVRGAFGRGYGGANVNNGYVDDGRDDSGAFLTGMMAGGIMSQPTYIDTSPSYDPGPGYDSGPSFDSGGSYDSGSSDSGSFDSGSSDGGGGGGDW